jgi:sec-independent protein translocase protein TatC
MTLGEHLEELRKRVIRSAVAVVLGMVLAFVFHERVFAAATAPYREALADLGAKGELQSLSPLDGFLQVMKLSLLLGLVATSPIWLSQMWGFVAAGLYPHERRGVRVFFPISVLLFLLGCVTAYLVVLPIGMRFLIAWSQRIDLSANFAVAPYLSMCLTLVFGMGVAFQLPLLMLFLQATGIVSRATFARSWRLAVLSAFVISMIVTPDPTPVSQCLMAMPLVALYVLGVWGGRFVGEGKERFAIWKAWPLLLVAAGMFAMFWWRRDLSAWATRLFS